MSRPSKLSDLPDKPPSIGEHPTRDGTIGDVSTMGDAVGTQADVDQVLEQVVADDAEVVDLAARYHIQKTLGGGGMGEVFLAEDKRLKRPVAIKRLRPELLNSSRAWQRFLQEAQAVARLNHYNIVQIYDYGRATDGPFLVLELIEGPSLAATLKTGPLPLPGAMETFQQVAEALQFAHDKGIVHRDVKPGNILLTAGGVPKLTDFGLARVDGGDRVGTRTQDALGTPDFMPPEQATDASRADARSDQWSLAATLYQMVTGELPRVIDLDLLPESLRGPIAKSLKTHPGERYGSVAEFGAAVREALGRAETRRTDPKLHEHGRCPKCGESHDSPRKFCRGCGTPLQEACLGCGRQNGVWESFCADCGQDLGQLVRQRRIECETRKQEFETLRREYRFREARKVAESIAAGDHPQLASQRAWAAGRLVALAAEEREQTIRRDDLLKQAKKSYAAADYGDVLKLLDQVPPALRSSGVRDVLTDARNRREELRRLAEDIRAGASAKRYGGLLEKVERFLELDPGHRKMAQVKERLSHRRSRHRKRVEMILERCRLLFAEFADKPVIDSLARISPDDADDEVRTLSQQAQARSRERDELLAKIEKAKAAEQHADVLPTVRRYLEITPRDARIREYAAFLESEERARRNAPKVWAIAIAGMVLVLATAATIAIVRSLPAVVVKSASTDEPQQEEKEPHGGTKPGPPAPGEDKPGPPTPDLVPKPGPMPAVARPEIRWGAFTSEVMNTSQTSQFLLLGNAPEFHLNIIGDSLEAATESFRALCGLPDRPFGTERLPVYVFRDAALYGKFLGSNPAPGATADGPGHATPEYLCVVDQALESAPGMKVHLSRLLAERLLAESNVPAWLHRGLALHVAHARDSDNPVVEQTRKAAWQSLRLLPSVSGLFDAPPGEAEGDAIGFALVNFLARKHGEKKLAAFVSTLREKGDLPGSVEAAFGASQTVVATSFASELLVDVLPSEWTTRQGHSLVRIPPGTFVMGASADDSHATNEEKPRHQVTLTRPFYLCRHEVTVAQFRKFIDAGNVLVQLEIEEARSFGWNDRIGKQELEPHHTMYNWQKPGFSQFDGDPVVLVSWDDANRYCEWLSRQEGRSFRLPTEAEWEYACRAGTQKRFSFGDDYHLLARHGNVADADLKLVSRKHNALGTLPESDGNAFTCPVRDKIANAWGLHNMCGNVAEWCVDERLDYPTEPVVDPVRGATEAKQRIVRGGSWHDGWPVARASSRKYHPRHYRRADVGFRIVMEIDPNTWTEK